MKFFKRSDIIIILIMVSAGLGFWIVYNHVYSDKPARAEIYYKSELIRTVDLNTGSEKEFSIPQNKHVVFHLYKDGSIAFRESDCPDKICIKSGKLSKIGETAACLPNEIFLKIVPADGENDNEIDMMAG